MKVTVGVLVKGKVQGEYYRQSTKEQPLQLGVKGYVQNLQDGSVYLVAEGSKEQVYNLINWCKRGPLLARVDAVIPETLREAPEFHNFEIRK